MVHCRRLLTTQLTMLQEEGKGVRLGRSGGDTLREPVGRHARAGDRGHARAVGPDAGSWQPLGRHSRACRWGDPWPEEPLGRNPDARPGQ
jgi:hypothetical protein